MTWCPRTILTADELLAVLRLHIGEERGASVDDLVAEIWPIRDVQRDAAAARRIRELVVELRKEGHHICAHPASGYFIAQTPEELDRTCLFLYERAMTSLSQIAAMKRISLPDLRGQLRLPT